MGRKKYIILAALFICAVILFGAPRFNIEATPALGLAILILAGGFWVSEALPLQVTGLLIPVAFVISGILTAESAFQPFSDPIVFLILGSLFIAEALRKHGLTRKTAVFMVDRCAGNPRLILLSIMFVGAITSMWVFSTAVVAMLIPVCLTISTRVEKENRHQFIIVLMMGLVLSTTLGALSTVLGASSNAVASGVLSRFQPWTFLDWMKYGTPLAGFLVLLAWLLLTGFFMPPVDKIKIESLYRDTEAEKQSKLHQNIILYVLGGAIFIWISSPLLEKYFGIPDDFMHSALVSLIAAGVLFATKVISWKDARQVNWGVYLIIGAGLALGKGLRASGVTEIFAGGITSTVAFLPFPVIIVLIILVSGLLSNIVNNTTVVAILAPILVDTAGAMQLAPTQLVLPMAFGATFGFLLPSASSRMALIYATNEISTGEMIKIGSIVTVPLVFITIGYFYLLIIMGWL